MSWLRRSRSSTKGFDEALALKFDGARAAAAKIMIPLMRTWFLLGYGAAGEAMRTKADDGTLTLAEIMAAYPTIGEAINTADMAADQYIAGYFDSWWRELEATTQTRLRAAIQLAREQGLQPGDVASLVEDLFGRTRAQLIATTEVTRLVGGGMQASYQAAGLTEWRWQTVSDDRVCPICAPLDGKKFVMGVLFQPAHPRCRCRPAPVTSYD